MNLIQNIDYLSTYRIKAIVDSLSKVCNDPKRLTIYPRSVGGAAIYAASDVVRLPNDSQYRDWRLQTDVKDLEFSYFERWVPIEKGDYYLERAYFHLYLDKKEYICLHTDPNEPEQKEGGYQYKQYKQSPHIHLSMSDFPLPKAHLALDNNNIANIISSIESLHSCFEKHIEMIQLEIIDRFK